VRLTALLALRVVGTADAMDALVERFLQEDGRLKQELYLTLKEIAHEDLGPNPNNWRAWWADQKKRFGGLPPAPPKPERNPADDRYGPAPEPPNDTPYYYGRRFYSRSLCYVLDTSGSMKYTMHIRPAEAATLGNIPTSGSRIEIARAALLDSLHRLDPRTRIRMVFFASEVRLWRPALLPASPATVDGLVSTLERVTPDGETNFHGALKAALGLHEGSTLDPDLGPMPDTVFFLTDGRPTRGEITSMPELTSWLRDLNRFAKIRLHVIALGELNVDIDSLRALAAAGDGDTIWVREQ
jgi:Mg-chelatase subunit ChlD